MPERRDVTFDSHGLRCAAWHLVGEGDAFAGERGRPCVVMAHGFGGTREDGLLPFAERFAAAGLDVVLFDYRWFGASEGEPRQLLSFRRQREDFHAAIAFARGLEGVDPDRIVLWGTSYSGGHVIAVGAQDGRVAAVVSQCPAADGLRAVLNIATYAGIGYLLRLTAAGVRDAIGARLGRPPVVLPVIGPPGSLGAMTTEDAEPGYRAITAPGWRNEFAARELLQAGMNRAVMFAADLPCPVLIQIADRDTIAPPKAARAAAWKATGRAEVRTYPIGHFDFYVGEPFERAVSDQLFFLRRHLAAAERPAAATAA